MKQWKVVILGILCLVSCLRVGWLVAKFQPYQLVDTSTKSYVKAEVIEIVDEDIEYSQSNKLYIGTQSLEVKIKQGALRGTVVEVDNYLTTTHNIKVSAGTQIILCVDAPENAQAYYTVYNYSRTNGLILLVILFLLLIIVIGKGKGIACAYSLVMSILILAGFLLPAVYEGKSPIICGIMCAFAITAITLYSLNGLHKKSVVATVSVVCGLLSSCIVYAAFAKILHIAGYMVEEGESLIVIAQNSGLQLGQIIFVEVIIASLGAVMDVSVSISSALYEVSEAVEIHEWKQLFTHGMNLGKDCIGTMCNTLILAFVGSAFTTFLVLISYNTEPMQLFNSNYFTIEAVTGIAGSMGMVLCVPLTAFLSAVVYTRNKAKKSIR